MALSKEQLADMIREAARRTDTLDDSPSREELIADMNGDPMIAIFLNAFVRVAIERGVS